MSQRHFIRIAALTCGLTIATHAHAQWTVTNLSPAGQWDSFALAVNGSQQGGAAYTQASRQARLWSGSATSYVDLNPIPATLCTLHGMSDSQQVGMVYVGAINRAALWTGSVASRVDLHPAAFSGSSTSLAYATNGSQQVGYAETLAQRLPHASLWSGTAASWVDLNPAGSSYSRAYAISGSQQAGFAFGGGLDRASLWSGTADSWVNLNPAGSTNSRAFAVSGSQQAGYAEMGGVRRASLWSGTATSWLDLSPAGSTESTVYAASGSQQAGYAVVGGVQHAGLWSGTAASWFDLHAFLPAGFTSSEARGMYVDGINTFIVGSGFNSQTNRTEALFWSQTIPTPGAAALLGIAGAFAVRRRRSV